MRGRIILLGTSIEVDARLRARQIVATLDRLAALHGVPRHLRCNNGPEFTSRAFIANTA